MIFYSKQVGEIRSGEIRSGEMCLIHCVSNRVSIMKTRNETGSICRSLVVLY